jgi:hypothetical protein
MRRSGPFIPHFYSNFYVYQYADQHDRRHVARGRHDRQGRGEIGQGPTEPRGPTCG